MSLTFDAQVLQLAQTSFSTVFTTPTYTSDNSAGAFSVVATGLSSGYTNADVQGLSSLQLMTLTFDVSSGSGALTSVLSGVVGAFVNQGTQKYLSDAPLVVTDYRGGAQSTGALVLETVVGVGVFAYSLSASLVNTATLNGQSVSSSVTVMQLYSRASSGSSITSQYTCSSPNSTVLTVATSSCTVSLTSQHTSGGHSLVNVLASDGTTLVQVPMVAGPSTILEQHQTPLITLWNPILLLHNLIPFSVKSQKN